MIIIYKFKKNVILWWLLKRQWWQNCKIWFSKFCRHCWFSWENFYWPDSPNLVHPYVTHTDHQKIYNYKYTNTDTYTQQYININTQIQNTKILKNTYIHNTQIHKYKYVVGSARKTYIGQITGKLLCLSDGKRGLQCLSCASLVLNASCFLEGFVYAVIVLERDEYILKIPLFANHF